MVLQMIDEKVESERFWAVFGWKPTAGPADPPHLKERSFWSDAPSLSKSRLAAYQLVKGEWKVIDDWMYSPDFLISKDRHKEKHMTDFVRSRVCWRIRDATSNEIKLRAEGKKHDEDEARAAELAKAEADMIRERTASQQRAEMQSKYANKRTISEHRVKTSTPVPDSPKPIIEEAEHANDEPVYVPATREPKVPDPPSREIRFDVIVICILIAWGILRYAWFPSILELIFFTPLVTIVIGVIVYKQLNAIREGPEGALSEEAALHWLGHFPDKANVPGAINNCIMFFDAAESPDIEELNGMLTSLLISNHSMERFKSVVVQRPDNKLYWHMPQTVAKNGVKTPAFKIEDHVFAQDVDDELELMHILEDLIAAPLDRNKPLWRLHLLRGVEEDGQSCVLIRVHPCIGDADSLIGVLSRLCTDEHGDSLPQPKASKRKVDTFAAGGFFGNVITGLKTSVSILKGIYNPVKDVKSSLGSHDENPETYTYPTQKQSLHLGLPVELVDLRYLVSQYNHIHAEPVKIALVTDEEKKEPEAEPIEDENALKPYVPHSATINDVVMFLWSRAVHRFLESTPNTMNDAGALVRFLLPCTLPHTNDGTLHVKSGTMSARLPSTASFYTPTLDSDAIIDGIKVMRDTLRISQDTLEPLVRRALNSTAQLYNHKLVQRWNLGTHLSHSIWISNAGSGPASPVLLAQKPVTALYYATPCIIPSVSMLSYAGELRMSIMCHDDSLSDPQMLFHYFDEEMKKCVKVLKQAGMAAVRSKLNHGRTSHLSFSTEPLVRVDDDVEEDGKQEPSLRQRKKQ